MARKKTNTDPVDAATADASITTELEPVSRLQAFRSIASTWFETRQGNERFKKWMEGRKARQDVRLTQTTM